METQNTLRKLLETIANGSYPALCVIGRSGIGKTYQTLTELERMNAKYFYVAGHITPLSLFKLLFQNNRPDVILLLDDCEEALKNPLSLQILKACIDTSQREVHWHSSYLKDDESIQKNFIYEGKIILILNKLVMEKNHNVKALISRCITYEINPTRQELEQGLRSMAKTQQEKEVAEFLIKNECEIDYRDFRKASAIAQTHKDWQPLVMELLKIDPQEIYVHQLLKRELPTKAQIQLFTNTFGKGERTYYRIRNKLTR